MLYPNRHAMPGVFLLGTFFLMATPNLWAQRINLEPGLWEYTNEMRMGDQGEPRTQVFESCVTQADLDSGDFMVQDIDACEMVEQQISANQLTYSMNCQGPEGTKLAVVAEISFDGDRASGVLNNTIATPMGDLAMAVDVAARRIGPCPEQDEEG